MKDRTPQFKCQRCAEDRSHYCLGMCNRCYQRHLREKNKDRKSQSQGGFSFQRKKNNYPFASPQIGENYQSLIPDKANLPGAVSYTRAYNYSDQENIEHFLKFCKLIFSDYPVEGDIIKGACGIEERALNLLEKYGDVHKAMYAVKNPVALALNPDLLNSLTQEEIEKEVSEVWRELVKVKIDNKDEFLEKMKNSVEAGITEQELQVLLQMATNMKVKVPKEITNQLTDSENFSKSLRKKLVDKSLTIEELRELIERINEFKVKTTAMQHLQEVLVKAEEWVVRSKKLVVPTVRQLQNLVTEGSALPLFFPDLANVKEKYKCVKKWTENAHGLIKSWRCKKDIRTPVCEVQALINDARSLQFIHHDIEILEEAIQKVFEWQERVKMAEEDMYCSKYIVQLLEEGQTLPLEIDSLEGMKNSFHWAARARKLLESKKINQKLLAQLINEGKNKNITSPLLKEMQSLLSTSKSWREKTKKTLSISNESTVENVQNLLKEGESLNIDSDSYLSQLRSKLNKIHDFQENCKLMRTSPLEKWTVSQIRNIRRQHSQLAIVSPDFDEIKQQLKSTENWISAAMTFIKKFPRVVPGHEELQILQKLIEECPSVYVSSQEHVKLEEFQDAAEQWRINADKVLVEENLENLFILANAAQNHPVDGKLFEKVSENAMCMEWRHKVQTALKDFDMKNLSKLKAELPVISLKSTSEYLALSDCLEKYEKWAVDLENICEEGNVKNLEDMYRSAREITIGNEQRVLIKRSLIGIYSWKERIRHFLRFGGEYNEGRALAKEGEYVCFECDEQEELSGLLEKVKIVKKKAGKVIAALPNGFVRSAPPSRIYKKRHLLEEYSLESNGDLLPDLIYSIENAIETFSPMEPHCFPLYHPTQGLSIIINSPVLYKPLKIPEEQRKKRSISYKQINEDVKNVKRPPRRPKNIEISRQSFCICKNEVSCSDTIMINCDYCGEWYHPSCISIDAEDIDKIEEFSCFLCYERIGIRSDRVRRQIINYQEFLTLANECNGKFQCDETREIIKISGRVAEWRVEAKEILESGLMLKEIKKIYESNSSFIEEQQYLFDGKIMKTLVEYEGLPIVMDERDKLLALLRKRDWLREVYQSICKNNSYRNIKKLIKERLAFDDEEFTEPVAELQKVLDLINDLSQQLQEILKSTPKLKALKVFFEKEEISQYKLELFEKNKKKIEQFENLLSEIKAEMQGKEKKKLQVLLAKAEKFGIQDELLEEASVLVAKS